MTAINIDNLSYSSAIETVFDRAPGASANEQSLFGDLLQQAQSQPTDLNTTAGQSNAPSFASTPDFGGAASSSPPSFACSISPSDADATSSPASPPQDNWQSASAPTSPNQQQGTQPAQAARTDAPSSRSGQQNAATNLQDHGPAEQASGGKTSHQDHAPAADSAQAHNSVQHSTRASSGSNSNTAPTSSASTLPNVASSSPSPSAPSTTPPSASVKPGSTPAPPGNARAPQATATPPAGSVVQTGPAQPSGAPVANGQINGANGSPASAPQSPTAETASTAVTAASSTAPSTGTGTNGPNIATSPNPDAVNAASGPGNQAEIAAPSAPAEPKPAHAAALQTGSLDSGAVPPSGQPAASDNTSIGSVGVDATLTADISLAQEGRTGSAIDSLSTPAANETSNTSAAKPGNAASSATAATPQSQAPGTTSANSSTSAAPTADTDLSQADRVRFVQRVEQAFQDLSGQGGSVRLRLSPPELGSLRIEISVAKGELTARVEAETPAARNVLLDNLPALRDRLAQHDIKVQRFDVDLMDRSGGGASNQSSSYQNPSQQNAPLARTTVRGGSQSPATVEAAASRPVSSSGRLNVVV